MMTLDEKVLAEAREARQKLVDMESQTAHARIDYHHAIKKLHAAGGSLREIAEVLELSHQRVHQIVEDSPAAELPPYWASQSWKRRGHRGRFLVRFDDDARTIVASAEEEADTLKHGYLGTEHLLLALLRRSIGDLDISVEAARDEIVKRVGEGTSPLERRRRLPFSPRAKRALEQALAEATAAGRRVIVAEDLLLAIASDPKSTGGEVLRALSVTPEWLRDQLGR